MSARSPYLKLERRIASSEHGGIIERWRYGRELLAARAGRQRLPKGLPGDLVKAAAKIGLTLSEQEIQRRMRLAEAYPTEAHCRHAVTVMGSWRTLVEEGFPPVDVPATDEDFTDLGVQSGPPDAWAEPVLFDIPSMPAEIKTRDGQKVPLADAKVGDAKAYRQTFREKHENYGKTLAVVEVSVDALVAASAGDDEMTIAEAWRIATGDDQLDEVTA